MKTYTLLPYKGLLFYVEEEEEEGASLEVWSYHLFRKANPFYHLFLKNIKNFNLLAHRLFQNKAFYG